MKMLGEQRIANYVYRSLGSTIKLVSVVKTTERVAHCPIYTQRGSLVFAHVLAKVRYFKCIASKMQCEHATAFSRLHERC